jgi:hypothetical protein
MGVPPARVLFGAAYYHEYQPYERLKTGLDRLADAHFAVIRVGESAWEPENGRFNLDWLQPVLNGAHERDLAQALAVWPAPSAGSGWRPRDRCRCRSSAAIDASMSLSPNWSPKRSGAGFRFL